MRKSYYIVVCVMLIIGGSLLGCAKDANSPTSPSIQESESTDQPQVRSAFTPATDENAKRATKTYCYTPPAKKGDIYAVFHCYSDPKDWRSSCKDTNVTVTWGNWKKSGKITGSKFWWGVVFHLEHKKNDSYQLCLTTDGYPMIRQPYQTGGGVERPLEWFHPLYKHINW
ncbi:hypothetical protein U14_03585 [Candidatus Moduliflexus flocculans]|uniref:Uncharacterized protein n=1 Tax=Candidatus Moduliflexus flocculans TaxID=1499966 RepID=A0A081BPL8_9BACT|nr:hypothetical protein U14_03585 [Candidatus Moduliflexus flocculans]